MEDLEAVKILRDANSQIENLVGSGPSTAAETPGGGPDPILLARQNQIARIVEGTRPAVRFAEVRDVQVGTLERCLADRGYVRFTLTDAQRRRLRRLKHGSDARHAYLHGLASDAAVLARQTVPPAASPPAGASAGAAISPR